MLCAAAARGLDPAVPLSQYGHDVWTSDSGLPQNSITTITQTHRAVADDTRRAEARPDPEDALAIFVARADHLAVEAPPWKRANDNGPGLKEEPSPAPGIGLANTRRRLEALSPGAHGLELAAAPEGGCEVRLRIPLEFAHIARAPEARIRRAS